MHRAIAPLGYLLAGLVYLRLRRRSVGLTPLEAVANDVPVLISKQSGVAEVL